MCARLVSQAKGAISSQTLALTIKDRHDMKVGAKVRVIGIPDGLEDYPDFPTKSTFTKCIGRKFVIAGFNEVGMAELDISSVNGSIGEKIWIEPQFLEFNFRLTRYRFRALLRTHRCLIYSSERPTQLRSTACRYPGLALSLQRLLPAHQARLLVIEE